MALRPSPRVETVIEFKAGRMIMEGVQVRADPRKGLFRVVVDLAGYVRVQWLDRTSGEVEEDQIVFPDEAVFEKVQQSSGHVYILKFLTDDRKLFFWLQEPDPVDDEHLCESVTFHINNTANFDDAPSDTDEIPPSQPIVETGEATPSGGGTVGNPRIPPVQLGELQQILANLGQSLGGSSRPFQDPGPSLTEVLKPDNVIPLLETSSHWEERLAPYLPEGKWTLGAIAELMGSPQFRQQLEMFTHALRSGQMDLQQFGIDPTKCDFTVASFLEAIQNQVAAAAAAEAPAAAETKADGSFGSGEESTKDQRDVEDMDH